MGTDSTKGFGGKFGVERDRVDSSAHTWEEGRDTASSSSNANQNGRHETPTDDAKCKEGAKNLKARFEQMAKSQEEDARKAGEAEKERRRKREEMEKLEEKKKKEAEDEVRKNREKMEEQENSFLLVVIITFRLHIRIDYCSFN